MTEAREVACLSALFFAFWFTIHHPFLVGSIIIGAILYWISNSPDVQKSISEAASNAYKTATDHINSNNSGNSNNANRNLWANNGNLRRSTEQDITMTRSGIERARKHYMENCCGSNKENEEDNTMSKLVLTYQVPILTTYYESIIQFFTR